MIPIINTLKCIRCGLCIRDCITDAIDPKSMEINSQACMGCGHCIAICPVEAASLPGPDNVLSNTALDTDFAKMVRNKRSVRLYTPDELSQEHLDALVDVVRFAPTGTNSQAVSVTVLATREKVRQAVKLALNFFLLAAKAINFLTIPFLYLFMGPKGASRILSYKRRLLSIKDGTSGRDILAHDAPALFIFHAPVKSATPSEDAVIWATTASYHAFSLGIGTCYNGIMTRAINASSRLKKWLGLPKGHRVYSTFTAGYPAVVYQRPVPRHKADVRILR